MLCLHWFNPFAWVAFLLMGVDMEMSCDERVLKEIGGKTKKDYSLSLLSLSTERRIIGGSPLAFGEGGMKERVKRVLNFKKPSRVIIIAAIALVAMLSAGFAVNRVQESLPWTGVAQKTDWSIEAIEDMNFNHITFGSDREWIERIRMGIEPDSDMVTKNGSILHYILLAPGGVEETVTFYLDSPECIEKKNLHGVYRIDVYSAFSEMAGRGPHSGTLDGVLLQYGKPNAVERNGDNYILWYYRPDDTDKRIWFEVKDGELTKNMGIVCVCDGEGVAALTNNATAPVRINIHSAFPNGIAFHFENNTANRYIYREAFVLYIYDNHEWRLVEPIIDNWGFNDEGYYIEPQSATETIRMDWEWLYGELPFGNYRIKKEVLLLRSPGDNDKFDIDAYFSISSDTASVPNTYLPQIMHDGVMYYLDSSDGNAEFETRFELTENTPRIKTTVPFS